MGKHDKKRRKKSFRKAFLFSAGTAIFVFVILSLSYTVWIFPKRPLFISPLSLDISKDQESATSVNMLEDLLREKNIRFSLVTPFDDTSYLVIFGQGEEVLFSSQKSLSSQVSSLQLIMSRLTIEGKRFTRIDFRFDTPVIITK
ncbi:MAG: hypothetical protein HYV39_01620 [Candidatus Levybacteria bacterium]|nr:hypothetical protein [Candidatus Levybacteria bacterium]